MPGRPPPLSAFTPAERRVIRRLRTPLLVQRFLNTLPYNTEPPPGRATLRSLRGVLRTGTAHCLESALAAAASMIPITSIKATLDGHRCCLISPPPFLRGSASVIPTASPTVPP